VRKRSQLTSLIFSIVFDGRADGIDDGSGERGDKLTWTGTLLGTAKGHSQLKWDDIVGNMNSSIKHLPFPIMIGQIWATQDEAGLLAPLFLEEIQSVSHVLDDEKAL
jgi:hypothetical protein